MEDLYSIKDVSYSKWSSLLSFFFDKIGTIEALVEYVAGLCADDPYLDPNLGIFSSNKLKVQQSQSSNTIELESLDKDSNFNGWEKSITVTIEGFGNGGSLGYTRTCQYTTTTGQGVYVSGQVPEMIVTSLI